MTQFSDRTLTDAVLKSLDATEDPRLREVVSGLVRHLHGFIREVAPTEAEWNAACASLPRPGGCVTTDGRSSTCCRTFWARP